MSERSDKWTLKRAREVSGLFSIDNSKMPGTTFALDAFQCDVGGRLADVEGSVCSNCNMRHLQKRITNAQASYQRNQERTEATLLNDGPETWASAAAFQLEALGQSENRLLASGDLPKGELGPLLLEAFALLALKTPTIKHWCATREVGTVIAWCKRRKGAPIPDNLVIRVSSPMVNDGPIKGLPEGIHTSTVHKGDTEPHGFGCGSMLNDFKCGDCHACWDNSIPNVSYQWHRYGRTAAKDLPAWKVEIMKQNEKNKGYGEDKWALLPESSWVTDKEFMGEEAALRHPIMAEAFEQSLLHHKPSSNICLITLCAASNDNSQKFKTFSKKLPDIDTLIMSNATFTSLDIWSSMWPYRSYDAPRESGRWDKEYEELAYSRMMRFFGKFQYDYVICNFLPHQQRNMNACRRAMPELQKQGRIQEFRFHPTWDEYDQIRDQYPKGTRQPHITDIVIDAIDAELRSWSNKE